MGHQNKKWISEWVCAGALMCVCVCALMCASSLKWVRERERDRTKWNIMLDSCRFFSLFMRWEPKSLKLKNRTDAASSQLLFLIFWKTHFLIALFEIAIRKNVRLCICVVAICVRVHVREYKVGRFHPKVAFRNNKWFPLCKNYAVERPLVHSVSLLFALMAVMLF